MIEAPTTARSAARSAPAPWLDGALLIAFGVIALASLIGLPLAAAYIPDGGARLELLAWTGAISVLVALLAVRLQLVGRATPLLGRGAVVLQPVLVFALVAVTALVTARTFRGMPQFPDSFAELFQARVLAAGRLWLPAPARPDLLQIANVVNAGGRWYAQYPIGNPAVLALGMLTGVSWLPAVLIALVLATGVRALARECTGEGAAALALALALASPMVVIGAAAGMSQASAAALGAWALALGLRARRQAGGAADVAAAHGPRPARWPSGAAAALGSGLAAGIAVTVRPLDGAVVGAAALAAAALAPERRSRRMVLWALAAATGVAPVLIANALTTGSPFRFGYQVLWGSGTLPGFGLRGWGVAFGAAQGLHNTIVDLGGLNLALLEWPVPVLVVLAGLLALRRSLPWPQRLLGLYVLAHVLVYFTYWHHDFFFGPRFLLPVVPALLALLADGLVWLVRRVRAGEVSGRVHAWPTPLAFVRELLFVQLAAAALLVAWPRLAHAGDPGIAAAAAVRDAATTLGRPQAVLLVDDGLGSRLFAQMWRMGVSAPAAERFYATADACRLERAIRDAQVAGRSGDATAAVAASLEGAVPGVAGRFPLAPRLRLPAGRIPPECAEELAYDAGRLGATAGPAPSARPTAAAPGSAAPGTSAPIATSDASAPSASSAPSSDSAAVMAPVDAPVPSVGAVAPVAPIAPFAPLLWLNDVDGRGVVFWRDPGPARLAALLRAADRPVYRVRVRSSRAGRPLVIFEPLTAAGPLRLP